MSQFTARLSCFLFFTLVLIFNGVAQDKPLDSRLLREAWPARWISRQEDDGKSFGVFHFRKEIILAEVPDSLWVHASADSRYRLYINGIWVSHGPASGDLRHWQFETLDVAPYLKKGKNFVTAEVWNLGNQRPTCLSRQVLSCRKTI